MNFIKDNKYLALLGAIGVGIIIGLMVATIIVDGEYLQNSKNNEESSLFSSFNDAVKKASPAVVNIYSDILINKDNNLPFLDRFNSIFGLNRTRSGSSLGSGVIFSSDGYILTNQHVIGDTNLSVTVELHDGRKQQAKIVGIDRGTDLAVLKINHEKEILSIEIGNSDNLKIGDIVLAIGNPYGLGQSVSMGIVSATGREFNNPYSDYIQTDASINRGNSGGALIDTSGRLVGINTLMRSSSGGSEGIGLAIPSVTVLGIINDLIQFGEVRRGWLGFSIDRRSLSLNNTLLVSNIHPNGPAKKAGVKVGDMITEINEKPSSYSLLFKEFARSKPGSLIKLKLLRNGIYTEIELITAHASDQ